MSMNHIDQNIRTSFHFVQNDVIALQNKQYELMQRVERLERLLMRQTMQQRTPRVLHYVGDRATREVHAPDCLLARSMDQMNQIVFESKQIALRSGFRECVCLY